MSIQYLLRDEIDDYPICVGKTGDPLKLSADRTAAYSSSSKTLDLSTPKIKGLSRIEERFRLGDQRYYFVRCLRCGLPQRLRWWRKSDDGVVSGIVWASERGRVVPGSVHYLCKFCGHAHTNADKTRLLSPAWGAEWRPTAEPQHPYIRSYHLSALYAPPEMKSWEACARDWFEACDVETGHWKDLEKLQVFYNSILGESYEIRGEQIRFANVSAHRRSVYRFGEIPNKWAAEHCGTRVLTLTCGVDVHADALFVAVVGWCRDRRAILVDYLKLEGDTEQLDNPGSWGRLQQFLENQRYIADDGLEYALARVFIDSGFRTEQVYRFCALYTTGVFPAKGQAFAPKSARAREFSEFTTPTGRGFGVTVDLYKDRWSAALRRAWDGQSVQPAPYFNAPLNASDDQLKELTREVRREKIDSRTGKRIGFEWHRPGHAPNELWDTLIYADAALDTLAWHQCLEAGHEAINWVAFWDGIQQ